MALLKQSTARNRMFLLVLSSDHLSPATGKSPAVTISKDGGAFAAPGGAVTEVSGGWYKVALTTTDTNTLGDLAFHVTEASSDATDFADQVVAALPGEKVAVTLAAADVSGNLPADLQTIKAQAVTCSGGVTVPAATLASTTNITAGTITTTTNLTNLPSIPANWVTAAGINAGAITAAKFAAGAIDAAAVADGAIDRATFAADTGLQAIRSGTAQGGTATTVTLDAGASASDDFYRGKVIYLTGGAGAGQSRLCLDPSGSGLAYDGTGKIANVYPNWVVAPNATTTFAVLAAGSADVEAFGGVAGTFSFGRPAVESVTGDVQGNVIGAVGSVNGNVAGDVSGKVIGGGGAAFVGTGVQAQLPTNGITAASVSAAAADKLADHGRRRTQAHVEASADGDALDRKSLYGFIQEAQNASLAGTTLTVKKTDGTTLGSFTVTTDAAALPVTGVS